MDVVRKRTDSGFEMVMTRNSRPRLEQFPVAPRIGYKCRIEVGPEVNASELIEAGSDYRTEAFLEPVKPLDQNPVFTDSERATKVWTESYFFFRASNAHNLQPNSQYMRCGVAARRFVRDPKAEATPLALLQPNLFPK
jgi:hypothetical protein